MRPTLAALTVSALMAIGGILAFTGEGSLFVIRRRAPRAAPAPAAAASQVAAP